jgi:hypothetical protein
MESPNDYSVTYAISAVSDPNNLLPLARWDNTAWIYQLYPLNKPTPRNSSDAKSIQLSSQTIFGNVRAVSQERSPTEGPLAGKKLDSVRFEVSIPRARDQKTKLDILFAIVPRDSAIDSRRDPGSTLNDRNPTRDFYRPTKDKTVVSRRDGIIVETFESGNDLIMPNGPGGVLYETGLGAKLPLYPKVDRTPTFVNSGDGKDVIIGGYGSDFFGGTSAEILWNTRNMIRDRVIRDQGIIQSLRVALNTSGSKLMIGGSNDDVLTGGSDQDYLVGDRFTSIGKWDYVAKDRSIAKAELAAELFLPTNAPKFPSEQVDLSSLPSFLNHHIQSINDYQPGYFYNQDSNNVALNRATTAVSRYNLGSLDGYQLWMPGNDIIMGGRNDDIIFGDDNSKYGAGDSLRPLIIMKE